MTTIEDSETGKVRKTAVDLVYEILENGAYSNIALDKTLRNQEWSIKDRNLLTEIVNGTIRMLKHLDWVLNLFSRKEIEKQQPWLRNTLRVAVYQILFMEKIPDYAVVSDAVNICRNKTNPTLGRVCNGILRNIIRNRDRIKYPQDDPIKYLSVYYSFPEWITRYLISLYGEDTTRSIMIYSNQRPEVVLRSNNLKIDRDRLVMILNQNKLYCTPSALTPWGIKLNGSNASITDLIGYKEGYFYVQNEASMLAAAILAPQENSLVMDLCAGVGGKSTHLAELMNNTGQIKAYDIHPQKLNLLQKNCVRLGITIVNGVIKDALEIKNSPEADQVLLDAPCSGLGVLNRRSDSRWRKNLGIITELQKLQLKLLDKAAKMVRNEGKLLYATCSITREENEDVISSFLSRNSSFKLEGFAEQISFFPLDANDRRSAANGKLTILPGKYDTDGMFYALMRRQ